MKRHRNALVHDVAGVFGWPEWDKLTLNEAHAVLRDVKAIAAEEATEEADELDPIRAARVLRTRIGGPKALKDYARSLVAGAMRRGVSGDKSNPKRKLSVPETHQLRIARQTLKLSDAGARIMGGMTKDEAREIIRRLGGGKSNPGLVDAIRPGDRVTIVDRFGKERTGRAVMRSSYGGWVLNMGGAHGTPALADERNIVRVKPVKSKPGASDIRLVFGNPRSVKFRAAWLPPNQRWVLLFGRTPGDSTIVDIDGVRMWETIDELKADLRYRGLTLDKGKNVVELEKKNPRGRRGRFRHRRLKGAGKLDPRSIRTVRSGRARILVGCPKGKYSAKRKRCKVGTRAEAVLTPKGRRRRALHALATVQGHRVHLYRGPRKLVARVAHRMANDLRLPVSILANPTLVHQGIAQRATFHILDSAGRPLADLYGLNLQRARAVAQTIADLIGLPVDVKPFAGSAREAARAVGSLGRARPRMNPGRPSSVELEEGAKTFQKWHGFPPSAVTPIQGARRIPKVLVALGRVPEIVYESDKWSGRMETYVHKTGRPKPVLATGPGGKGLYLVGGNVKVTSDGLVG